MPEVDIFNFVKVKQCKLILQVTNLVADRNSISIRKSGALKGFVKGGNFLLYFFLNHTYNITKKTPKVKLFFAYFISQVTDSQRLALRGGGFPNPLITRGLPDKPP